MVKSTYAFDPIRAQVVYLTLQMKMGKLSYTEIITAHPEIKAPLIAYVAQQINEGKLTYDEIVTGSPDIREDLDAALQK